MSKKRLDDRRLSKELEGVAELVVFNLAVQFRDMCPGYYVVGAFKNACQTFSGPEGWARVGAAASAAIHAW